MKLTKKELEQNYPIRKYPFDKYEYTLVLDVIKDYQVFRYYNYLGIEIQRLFMNDNGKIDYVVSYGCWCNQYALRFDLAHSTFKVRRFQRISIAEYKVYIKAIKDKFKRFLTTRNSLCAWYEFALGNCEKEVETLLKINPTLIKNIYERLGYHKDQLIKKFNRTLQLITKYNYKIKAKELNMYFDYLGMLDKLGLDIRNKKYICPDNLKKAHDLLNERLEKKKAQDKIFEARAYIKPYQKKMNKLMGLAVNINGIKIIPLWTINEVLEEGTKQHHCVFNNGFYKKEDSLLFTSYVDDIKAETIEYSIKENRVIQCYGAFNKLTERHKEIVDLANREITNYLRSEQWNM